MAPYYLLVPLLFAGIFDAPTAQEAQAERERCYESALCRLLIDDRPPVLFGALSDEPWCAQHAINAETYLKLHNIPYRLGAKYFEMEGVGHVYIIATVNNQEWAIDNGALPWCDRICTLDEALH